MLLFQKYLQFLSFFPSVLLFFYRHRFSEWESQQVMRLSFGHDKATGTSTGGLPTRRCSLPRFGVDEVGTTATGGLPVGTMECFFLSFGHEKATGTATGGLPADIHFLASALMRLGMLRQEAAGRRHEWFFVSFSHTKGATVTLVARLPAGILPCLDHGEATNTSTGNHQEVPWVAFSFGHENATDSEYFYGKTAGKGGGGSLLSFRLSQGCGCCNGGLLAEITFFASAMTRRRTVREEDSGGYSHSCWLRL